MLKKLVIGAGLTLCLAACATSPSAPDSRSTTAKAEPPAGCVPDTASRIPMSEGQCAAFGRTWTEKDIKSTGATDTGQALRLLDPSLTVHE